MGSGRTAAAHEWEVSQGFLPAPRDCPQGISGGVGDVEGGKQEDAVLLNVPYQLVF